MPEELVFPSEAIESARAFGEQKMGLSSQSSEADLEERIMQLKDGVSYGIAQAIQSGSRLRLFHELDTSSMQLNCGEVAITGLEIYRAFSQRRDLQLIRYQPYPGVSDHFGIVHSFEDNRGKLVDPFMGLHGQIELSKDGFIFYPFSWLASHDQAGTNPNALPVFAMTNDRNNPVRVMSDVALLGEDSLMRHINYINSPLGFFAYLGDGQKLEEKVTEDDIMMFTAEIDETGLVLRGMCSEKKPLMFTLERRYSFDGAEPEDCIVLHPDFDLVRPKMAVYAVVKGEEDIPIEIDVYMQAQVIHRLVGPKPLFTPHERGWLLRRMQRTLDKWKANPPEEDDAIFTLLDLTIINFPQTDFLKTLEDQITTQRTITSAERRVYLDLQLNRMNFMRYAMEQPNNWPKEEVLARLRPEAARLEEKFAGRVREYFSSGACSALLRQYHDSVAEVLRNAQLFEASKPVAV